MYHFFNFPDIPIPPIVANSACILSKHHSYRSSRSRDMTNFRIYFCRGTSYHGNGHVPVLILLNQTIFICLCLEFTLESEFGSDKLPPQSWEIMKLWNGTKYHTIAINHDGSNRWLNNIESVKGSIRSLPEHLSPHSKRPFDFLGQ